MRIESVRKYSGVLLVLMLAAALSQAALAAQKTEPWIDAADYRSLGEAIKAAGSADKAVMVATPQKVASNLTVPENVCLWFVRGGCLEIAKDATVVIKGDMEAGLFQIFKGDGIVKFGSPEDPHTYRHGSGNIREIYAEWWGARGDSKTDCTQALQKALNAADYWRTLRLVDGRYAITSTLTVKGPILGNSPNNSVIWNKGTGDCLYFASMSYKTWRDFGVEGNPESRDGICLYDPAKNPAGGVGVTYSNFVNVSCYNNGRHGLYHKNSWATKYVECKFVDNGGLGAYIGEQCNGVTLLNCDASWNGGDDPNTTINDEKGGVKVVGAAMVSIEGGIYESNNPWGFIIGNQNVGTNNVHIRNIYMENIPRNSGKVKEGGYFYLTGHWSEVTVEQSWLPYGAAPGQVGYCFYVDRADENARFRESNNTLFAGVGTTASSAIRYRGVTHAEPKVLISKFFGDLDNANKATKTTILKASRDGRWTISGSIHVTLGGARDPSGLAYIGQDSTKQENVAAVYPFIVTCDGVRTVCNVGNPTVGALQEAPKMSFNNDELQVDLPGYETAFVKVEEQVLSKNEPKVFDFSREVFGEMMRRW